MARAVTRAILKISKFVDLFIIPRKVYRLPRRRDLLIYDVSLLSTLNLYIACYDPEILYMRGECVNVPCFIHSLFDKQFWLGKPVVAYIDAYIRHVKPKLIITYTDNDPKFYTITSRFSGIKTLFLQNGSRTEVGDIFSIIRPSPDQRVDFMLVHNEAIAKKFGEYIQGETIVCGSMKNNMVALQASNNSQTGPVVFVSQYIAPPVGDDALWVGGGGELLYYEDFFLAEKLLLNFLKRYCVEKGRELAICGRNILGDGEEEIFFSNLLSGCKWKYFPRSETLSSYHLIDSAKVVVFIDSTLGYEALGRGKRTAGFSIRKSILNSEAAGFGWPADFPESGPFWTNQADEQEFRRVLDFLLSVSEREWDEILAKYRSKLMEYDPENAKFLTLLYRLLPVANQE